MKLVLWCGLAHRGRSRRGSIAGTLSVVARTPASVHTAPAAAASKQITASARMIAAMHVLPARNQFFFLFRSNQAFDFLAGLLVNLS